MPYVIDSIRNSVLEAFRQRYLQGYIQHDVKINQLSVNARESYLSLGDLVLDHDGLNQKFEQQKLPFVFVKGKANSLNISIPWPRIGTESSFIEVKDLTITIRPKQASDNASLTDSIVDSMSSMASSMQMAYEASADSKDGNEKGRKVEGVEGFSNKIDEVLRTIKARFLNTTLRMENVPNERSKVGTFLQLNIEKIDYFDATTTEKGTADTKKDDTSTEKDATGTEKREDKATYSCSTFHLYGVTISSGEFGCDDSDSQTKSTDYSTAPETPEPNTQSSIFADSLNKEESNATSFSYLTSNSDILIAKLTGQNEIRLRLKQCDTVPGSKFSLELTLGTLIVFLSPRQLVTINELLSSFIGPDAENDRRPVRPTSKPIDGPGLIQAVQSQINSSARDRSLANPPLWSSQQLEDSCEEFFPARGPVQEKFNSCMSTLTTSVDSCTSSIVNDGASTRNFQSGDDKEGESKEFKMNLNCFAVILLHENILRPAANINGMMVHSSVIAMKLQVENFFKEMGNFVVSTVDWISASKIHAQLSSACRSNHLRFLGVPCSFEALSKESSNKKIFSSKLLLGDADLVECLFDDMPTSSQADAPTYYYLLTFDEKLRPMWDGGLQFYAAAMANPAFRLQFNHWESAKQRRKSGTSSRSEFDFYLAPCIFEVDMSIIDRISALLNPKEIFGQTTISVSNEHDLNDNVKQVIDDNVNRGDCYLKLSSPLITVKLRFPIPDMRPLADMNRVSWWQRTIRDDSLLLNLTDARFHTTINSDKTFDLIEIRCRELQGLFQENDSDPLHKILWAYAGNDQESLSVNELGWPRICFQIRQPCAQSILEVPRSNEDVGIGLANGSIDAVVQQLFNVDKTKEPCLFNTRKIVYQTSKLVNDSQEEFGKDASEEDELIMPGERKDAVNFMEWANSNCRYILDINVENLKLFLPSKHVYEVLYNRITEDLLLWAPAIITSTSCKESSYTTPATLNLASNNELIDSLDDNVCPFRLCVFDSGSESDENCSTYPFFNEIKPKNNIEESVNVHKRRYNLSVTVNSKRTCIELNLPNEDSLSEVVPQNVGRLHILTDDCQFSILAPPDDSSDSSYICLHANRALVYHKGNVSASTIEPHTLTSDNINIDENLVLHLSDGISKVKTLVGDESDNSDMISLVVRTVMDKERNLKTFRLAFALRGATYHYLMSESSERLFTQVSNFFNVTDYPIAGYEMPRTVTEMHIHAWECAIDYRPLYLPLRVMLNMDSFSITSNVAVQTNSSIVKMILEEACLSLSKQCATSNVNLKLDYVCVMDLSLFELILLMNDEKNSERPKKNLQAFISKLNIRTCVDSCIAIQDLLKYFANDGDLPVTQDLLNEDLQSGGYNRLNMDCNDESKVRFQIDEAMRESMNEFPEEINKPSTEKLKPAVDMVLFPGESVGQDSIVTSDWLESEISSFKNVSLDDSFDYDSYCILGEDFEGGILPSSLGEPQVRVLTEDLISAIDNYFKIPSERTDKLKAPGHYPPPAISYTLTATTITWDIFDGEDFSSYSTNDRRPNNDRLRNSSSGDRDHFYTDKSNVRRSTGFEMSFNKSQNQVVWRKGTPTKDYTTASTQESCNSTCWIERGGPKRQTNVRMAFVANKIRFRHESYAECYPQASRQVLLVQTFEIIDRMALSRCCKFLHQHPSERPPHSNAMSVKAVHRRHNQECDLKVAVHPLKLNIEQDSLGFVINFFSGLSSSRDVGNGSTVRCHKNSAAHQAPVLSFATKKEQHTKSKNENASESHNYLIQFDDLEANLPNNLEATKRRTRSGSNDSVSTTCTSSDSSLFFSSFEFVNDVPIKFDYQGNGVDLGRGPMAGIVMGLAQLSNSEIKLKKSYRVG
ncbi:autophagy- protein 2 [Chamberlinius hualienensis]